ncbi:MAG: hypothetical protein KTR14_03245 [Vampirovibrio sp.]|nr:hypothetical protein [Vampirovibrio sp.]
MVTENILLLEKDQAYGDIYDEYASTAFKKQVSRRQFLKHSQCTEDILGNLVEFRRPDIKFVRENVKGQSYDLVALKVQRTNTEVVEHMTYVREGLNFKINAFYWSSDKRRFKDCIRAVEKQTRS